MKMLISILFLSLIQTSHGMTFKVLELCENKPHFQAQVELSTPTNVGKIIIDQLQKNSLPYIGNEDGLNSVLDTPVGMDGYEVISDERMRVYGWCYKVDGVNPNELMSKIYVFPGKNKEITLFYAYAELIKDQWISYCVPVYEEQHPFVCK